MIRVIELTKRYGSTLALDQLSLDIPAGSVFGLLGPNGAGKTTLLRVIMGFIFPDSGQLELGDLHPASIGFLPERAFYPPGITVRRYLSVIGGLAGLPPRMLRQEVDRLLSQVGLGPAAGRRLGACSRGMLQRLGLAQVLVGDPPLLILDEPVLGLDPAGQKFMRDQIIALRQAGKTVLLASHHLDQVARVCTHVGVLNQGRLVRTGPLETILSPHPRITILTSAIPDDLRSGLMRGAPDIIVAERRVVLTGAIVPHKERILRILLDAGVDVRSLEEQHTTLEEIYLEATDG
jgi:ABC-2 type transport system ATP-binding protein